MAKKTTTASNNTTALVDLISEGFTFNDSTGEASIEESVFEKSFPSGLTAEVFKAVDEHRHNFGAAVLEAHGKKVSENSGSEFAQSSLNVAVGGHTSFQSCISRGSDNGQEIEIGASFSYSEGHDAFAAAKDKVSQYWKTATNKG